MRKDSFAISTTWNYTPDVDIKQMLYEIRSVGLDAIEIGYNLSSERLKEFIPLLNTMNIKVVSVHNFCPLPEEPRSGRFATDYYRLSSLDKKERSKAVSYTKRSIDTASSVSCELLVIHAGTIEFKDSYVRALPNLYRQGKSNSDEYRTMKEKLLIARQNQSRGYLESVAKSLEEILSYARSAGIKIGLETRYYLNEIPDLEEAEYLLNLFKDKGLAYWHDIGHAEVNQRLGITSHNDYLQRFAGCMVGVHLHDLCGIDDHMAPFSGDFDWSLMTPYMRDDLIKVIEAHPPATPQQIKKAINRLSNPKKNY